MSGLLIAKTPAEINFWHLCSLRGALRLQKAGLGRRGPSALTIAKKEFGLKSSAKIDDAIAVVQAEIERQLAARESA